MRDNSDKIIAEKILLFTTSLRGKKVLEIGCGNGRITSFLADKPQRFVAIEPEYEKIREARDTIPGVIFQIASGENLAFSDASFDLVIFTLSLHHQNSDAAIAEATRVLPQGGEIIIVEPTINGEVQRSFSLVSSENRELLNAQKAIKNSGLIIQESEIFNAIWTFDNKEELCRSIFDYYNAPFDSHTAGEIISFVGAKAEDEPIELVDELVIQFIKKPLSS